MAAAINEFVRIGNFLSCIYGKPATGKTNICIAIAAAYSKSGKVAFIDTENTFSPLRFNELGGNLQNLILFNAKSFREQAKAVESFSKVSGKLKLVIVDSLTSHYRSLVKEDINSKFSKHLSQLSDLARLNIPIIFTSQVYSTDKKTEMVGSSMLRNWSSAIIRLENERKRIATIEKHPESEVKSCLFEIKSNEIYCIYSDYNK